MIFIYLSYINIILNTKNIIREDSEQLLLELA